MVFEYVLFCVDAVLVLIASAFVFLYKHNIRNNQVKTSTTNPDGPKISCFEIENMKLEPDQPIPRSVNYHFTRKCNYQCGFCFHTAKTSYMLDLDDAKRGLRMLKNAGKF